MSRISRPSRWPRGRDVGQSMVEFAFTVVIFIALLMGVFDLGRAVFMSNGVAESARDIARVASVHPGKPLSNPTPDTQAVIDRQQSIINHLQDPIFSCVDITGQTVATPGGACLPGNWVKVEIHAPWNPATPILNLLAIDLSSSSSIQIP